MNTNSTVRTAKKLLNTPVIKTTLGLGASTGLVVSTIPKAYADSGPQIHMSQPQLRVFNRSQPFFKSESAPATVRVTKPNKPTMKVMTKTINQQHNISGEEYNMAVDSLDARGEDVKTPDKTSSDFSLTRMLFEPTFKQTTQSSQKQNLQESKTSENIPQKTVKQNLTISLPKKQVVETIQLAEAAEQADQPTQEKQAVKQTLPPQHVQIQQKMVRDRADETEPAPAEQGENTLEADVQESNLAIEKVAALTQQAHVLPPVTTIMQEPELQAPNFVEEKAPLQTVPRLTPIKISTWTQQQPDELSQILMEQDMERGSKIITSWQKDYPDTTANMYVQANLKDALVQELFGTDVHHEVQYVQKKDIKLVESLRQKYKNNPDVYGTLTELLTTLKKQQNIQKPTAQQANKIITHYFTPEMKADVLIGMGIQPKNPANPSESLPSIEKIIEHAEQNFSSATYKALKAAEKGIDVAIFAHQQESSMLTDTPLLTQLKQLKKDIQATRKKPQFEQYQSFGEQVPQYTANFLDNTGLGDVTLQQAYTGAQTSLSVAQGVGNFVIDAAGARPYVTLAQQGAAYGIQQATNKAMNTTVLQTAQAVGLMPSKTVPDTAHVVQEKLRKQSESKPLSPQQQRKLDFLDERIAQTQAEATHALSRYAKPQDLQNILKPFQSSSQGTLNIPTAQELIQFARNNPSQDTYNSLKSMLATVKVTLRPELTPADPFYIQGWTKYKQLKEYEQLLTQALQEPQFMQFKPIASQATSYLTSYLPSAETILTSTGIGNMTLKQLASTAQIGSIAQKGAVYLQPLIDTARSYAPRFTQLTGVELNPKNLTIRQTTDAFGLTPAATN